MPAPNAGRADARAEQRTSAPFAASRYTECADDRSGDLRHRTAGGFARPAGPAEPVRTGPNAPPRTHRPEHCSARSGGRSRQNGLISCRSRSGTSVEPTCPGGDAAGCATAVPGSSAAAKVVPASTPVIDIRAGDGARCLGIETSRGRGVTVRHRQYLRGPLGSRPRAGASGASGPAHTSARRTSDATNSNCVRRTASQLR